MHEAEPINGGFNAYSEELAFDAIVKTVQGASEAEKFTQWKMRRRAHGIASQAAEVENNGETWLLPQHQNLGAS